MKVIVVLPPPPPATSLNDTEFLILLTESSELEELSDSLGIPKEITSERNIQRLRWRRNESQTTRQKVRKITDQIYA